MVLHLRWVFPAQVQDFSEWKSRLGDLFHPNREDPSLPLLHYSYSLPLLSHFHTLIQFHYLTLSPAECFLVPDGVSLLLL